jgi:uroporphyrinogen decarboxylase
MKAMTGKERITNILKREPVDRIGFFENFWSDTLKEWRRNGYVKSNEDLVTHFDLDISMSFPFQMIADLNFETVILEEDEDTILTKNGNGAILRNHKKHNGTPEHIDFSVKDRKSWEELIKPNLTIDRERINFDDYRNKKRLAEENNRFFCWCGVNVFELMHPVCGHEFMLMGMALDPDWVKDMVKTYSELTVGLMEILFSECGKPDGIWFFEDMGFKQRPFMSLDMYREIIQAGHKRTIDFAHSLGLPVVMHSCGFVEPLLPGMIESGIDCLQAIEVKAGMDLLRIYKNYGDKISLCGGMDARNLVSNDINAIQKELEEKIPILKEGFGYILHSDHSIPNTCNYDTYKFFVNKGLELGTL